ncbi:uncharacterized protein LOC111381936 [Olea europaea var. sylvestris]|uniref:uncharacterized protein LOC111381936 n=1 Tax=Olea europaea var. sylvestris TaxID=158386 RepID=UPI000C1D229E|nr:uncharacterized protein LOC111381936 [Olea europaea var. sylvestris]
MGDVPGDAPSESEDVEMIDVPPISKILVIDEIDPHIIEHEPQASPIEELESFSVDPRDPSKLLKVGKGLSNSLKEKIKDFLSRNIDIFAWRHEDIVGIDPKISCHHLKIDPKVAPFPLLRIDQLVDSTARHELLNFMDAYSDHNQIPMHPVDEEHTSFITDGGLYCYKMMPFELKNVGATYQMLDKKEFVDLIGKTMEVYVDYMLVKSLEAGDHVTHLNNTFQILRRYLGQASLLSKPKLGEILQMYLVVSNEAISAVLIREEGTTQLSVYYTSKVLLSSKSRYPDMEKLALALITASRKLKPYFQAHAIHVLTNFPLRQARAAIKGQALADFVVEFANLPEVDEIMKNVKPSTWNLFVDGSAGDTSSGARVVLISPKGHKLNSAIPHVENAHAIALSKLTSSKDSELLTVIPIEHLLIPSTEAPNVMWVAGTPTWIQPIVTYLKDHVLPTNKHETYKLRRRSTHFLFINDVFYKRSFSSPLLRCLGGEEATYILREVHEGVYDNYSGGLSLAQKILRHGYYWPTLKKDALQFVREYNGKQFENKKVRSLCEELGIKKYFSTSHHPQANSQVEVVNKTIKHVLKKKLDMSKGPWVDELPQVLWAIRTTTRTPTRETPFLMAYGTEAMSPVEVGLLSPRCLHFNEITNDELRRFDLNFIEEIRDDTQLKLATYQRKMTKHFNSKVNIGSELGRFTKPSHCGLHVTRSDIAMFSIQLEDGPVLRSIQVTVIKLKYNLLA